MKIKRKILFTAFVATLCVNTTRELLSMGGFWGRYTTAQGFKRFMTRLSTVGYFYVMYKPLLDSLSKKKDEPYECDKITKEFVRHQLRQYNFPENMVSSLSIYSSKFSAKGSKEIFTPLNSHLLKRSFERIIEHDKRYNFAYKSINDHPHSLEAEQALIRELDINPKLARNIVQDVQFYRNKLKDLVINNDEEDRKNLSPYSLQAELNEMLGISSPESLLVFKGSIAHEGSHIYHNDSFNKYAVCLLAPLAIHNGLKVSANTLEGTITKYIPLFAKPSVRSFIMVGQGVLKVPSLFAIKLPVTFMLLMANSRKREKKADYEAIGRAHDPAVLYAKAKDYTIDAISDAISKKNKRLIDLLGSTHPSSATRAAYFLEAAQELEKRRTEQINSKVKNS